MNPLARLLELVQRTQLPLIVQPSDSTEPCVLVPLSVYEQLTGTISDRTDRIEEKLSEGVGDGGSNLGMDLASFIQPVSEPSLLSAMLGPIPSVGAKTPQEPNPSLQLQELLRQTPDPLPKQALSPIFPQVEAMEDRFAFDGLDVRILPKSSKKNPSGLGGLDESQ